MASCLWTVFINWDVYLYLVELKQDRKFVDHFNLCDLELKVTSDPYLELGVASY